MKLDNEAEEAVSYFYVGVCLTLAILGFVGVVIP